MTYPAGSTAVVLLLALLSCPISAQINDCPPLEIDGCCGLACQQGTCQALYMLGSSMGAAGWHDNTGWADVLAVPGGQAAACAAYMANHPVTEAASPPYCSWYGITCNTTRNSSTCSSPASGTTAYSIRRIEITNNNMAGFVNATSFLAPLRQLHDCYGLTQFIMGGGAFMVGGTIPAALGELDRLEVLALFATNISGTLPADLGKMKALKELDLSSNYITGTIPPQLGNLINLSTLNLGYNGFTDMGKELYGTLPASFSKLSNLTVLMLEHNALTGTLPELCPRLTQLQAVSLRNNAFHGPVVQFGECQLTALDISDNNFSGFLPMPARNSTTWQQLMMLRLNNNRFLGPLPTFAYGEAPILSVIVLSRNFLTGTIPVSWTLLPWLTVVDLGFNQLSGTLPWELAFQSKLSIFNLNNNKGLFGTISPFWRFTVGLSVLNLGYTNISGALPGISRSQMKSGLVPMDKLCTTNASGFGRLPSLDAASIAGTKMSAACTAPGTSYDNYSECWTMEDALPWYLTPDSSSWQIPPPEPDFADNANMACPGIVQDLHCERDSLPLYFSFDQRPRWSVSPSYYHYIGCECEAGYNPIHELAWHGDVMLPRLRCVRGLTIAEVAGISVVASIVGLALISYCVYVSWSGRWGLPKLRRAYVDIQKRLHGAPTSGKVSLVVTDIESYSALMVAMPLVMAKALSQHNNAVRKAVWVHFGNIVCQEGDSYTIAFRGALDAVAFCLQVQQALQKIDWPPELLSYMQQAAAAAPDSVASSPDGLNSAPEQQQQGTASVLQSPSENCGSHTINDNDMGMTNNASGNAISRPPAGAASAADGGKSTQGRLLANEQWNSSSGDSSVLNRGLWSFRTATKSDSGQLADGYHMRHRSSINELPDDAAAAGSDSGQPQQQQQQQQQPPLATIDFVVPGLRVRMGVASGVLDDKEDCMSSKVLQVARVVSDAGSGGQVLIDSNTFSHIKDRLEELGQVGASGYSSQSMVVGWGTPRGWLAKLLARDNLALSAEALVLDMGLYSIPGFNFSTLADAAGLLPDLPCLTSPLPSPTLAAADSSQLQPDPGPVMLDSTAAAAEPAQGKLLGPRGSVPLHWLQQPAAGAAGAPALGSPVDISMGAGMATRHTGCLRLYQVLAPKLVERAHLFGNNLSLKDGSICYDLPYFCAPAAATRPTLDPLRQQLAAKQSAAGSRKASDSGSFSALERMRSVQQQKFVPEGGSSQAILQDTEAGAGLATGGISGVFRSAIANSATAGGWWRRQQPFEQRQRSSMAVAGSQLQRASAAAGEMQGVRIQECTASNALQPQPVSGLSVPKPLILGRSAGFFEGDAAVTFVFCSVVNPRAKLSMDPSAKLGAQVASIVSKALRQCLMALAQPSEVGTSSSGGSSQLGSAGYMCREMKGDMKYIMVFNSPRFALEWCLLVQEVMLWQDWPAALFDLSPPQPLQRRNPMARVSTFGAAFHAADATDAPMIHIPTRTGPLFRGPRIKMGVAAGAPQCVGVDHLGRADYHGNAINMAARYEMVCAQGGQVVCDAALAGAVVAEWRSMAGAAASKQSGAPWQGTAHNGRCSQLQLPQSSTGPFSVEQIPLSGVSATHAVAVGPPAAVSNNAGGLVTSASASSGPCPRLHEDRVSIELTWQAQQNPTTAVAAPAAGNHSRPGAAGIVSAGSAAALQTQPLPLTPLSKRTASEQLPASSTGTVPGSLAAARNSSPLLLASPAPHAATGGGSAATGNVSSSQAKPAVQAAASAGGLAAWLAAGSKASLGQLTKAQAGRKSAGSKALRAAQRHPHRTAVLVMAPASTELPCALCVPQLPSENFGVDVRQLGKFLVKGHAGPVEIVELSLSHLSARRRLLADAPPKSQKGRCIQPSSGHIASVRGVQLPGLADLYKRLHEQRKAAAAAVATAADTGASIPGSLSGSLTLRQASITQLVARASSVFGSIGSASSRALSWERVAGAQGSAPGMPRPGAAAVQSNLSQQPRMSSLAQV